jgi:hypothetical protein
MSGFIDPYFLDLGTIWRWVVSFTPQPLYLRVPGTHWIWGWVGSRTGPDDVGKTKFLTLPGLELWPLRRQARSQSQYRLRYPDPDIDLIYWWQYHGAKIDMWAVSEREKIRTFSRIRTLEISSLFSSTWETSVYMSCNYGNKTFAFQPPVRQLLRAGPRESFDGIW